MSSAMSATQMSASALLERYDEFLLDAYGVLVDGSGALPNAVAFVQALQQRRKPFAIVTNDASRSPTTCANRFVQLGMNIGASQIVTSGDLIGDYFAAHNLAGARTLVLGTSDSRAYIEAAKGVVTDLAVGIEADVIAICDDNGFPFLAGCEIALSAAFRQLDAGKPVHLLLPNPDIIYPKSAGEYGFTSGAIAAIIEAGLVRRYHHDAPSFVRLGKPAPQLLLRGKQCTGGSPLMIGDQLETDIASANAAGIDSALIAGVSKISTTSGLGTHSARPTYLLPSLQLD
jgi:HAD superfamily hydrolase (TIGR01459 family)